MTALASVAASVIALPLVVVAAFCIWLASIRGTPEGARTILADNQTRFDRMYELLRKHQEISHVDPNRADPGQASVQLEGSQLSTDAAVAASEIASLMRYLGVSQVRYYARKPPDGSDWQLATFFIYENDISIQRAIDNSSWRSWHKDGDVCEPISGTPWLVCHDPV